MEAPWLWAHQDQKAGPVQLAPPERDSIKMDLDFKPLLKALEY